MRSSQLVALTSCACSTACRVLTTIQPAAVPSTRALHPRRLRPRRLPRGLRRTLRRRTLRKRTTPATQTQLEEWRCTGELMLQLLSAKDAATMEQIVASRQLTRWIGKTTSPWRTYAELENYGWSDDELRSDDDFPDSALKGLDDLLDEFGIPNIEGNWVQSFVQPENGYIDSQGNMQHVRSPQYPIPRSTQRDEVLIVIVGIAIRLSLLRKPLQRRQYTPNHDSHTTMVSTTPRQHLGGDTARTSRPLPLVRRHLPYLLKLLVPARDLHTALSSLLDHR